MSSEKTIRKTGLRCLVPELEDKIESLKRAVAVQCDEIRQTVAITDEAIVLAELPVHVLTEALARASAGGANRCVIEAGSHRIYLEFKRGNEDVECVQISDDGAEIQEEI